MIKFRKLNLIFTIGLIIGTLQPAKSQLAKNNSLLRRATIEYQNLRFTDAIKVLQRVLEKDPHNVSALEMIAGSNRKIKNYDEALYWYGELCKQKNIRPEWALYFAEALANKQKYEESKQWYSKYAVMRPTDRRADAFSKADFKLMQANTGNYKIKFLNINSEDSEYSPIYYKNGLLFISNRTQNTRFVFQWDRSSYSDIYILDDLKSIQEIEPPHTPIDEIEKENKFIFPSETRNNSLIGLLKSSGKKDPRNEDEPYLLKGKVRSTYHEGPAVLLPEGNLMFTRNSYISGRPAQSKTGINKLNLLTASGKDWERITPFPFNNNEYSTGHPAISPDGKMLIFASDMPNGFGGTDLYYCLRRGEGEKWSKPVNLGPEINTEGNEQFPYLHNNGKLYFSSTGHPGLGGLDIFGVVLKDMKVRGVPRNMGAGINSSGDDFGFIQDEEGKSGFFSSNRRGNDDIYQFERIKSDLIQKNENIDTVTTDRSGEFTMSILRESNHELKKSNMPTVGRQLHSGTGSISADTTLNVVRSLNKMDNSLDSAIDSCKVLKKNFTFENVYYDLNRADIRPDAALILNRIAELMKKNPETRILSASHTDSRASIEYNNKLSLRRGESVRNYLVSKGIDKKQIEVRYYGKSRLINSCKEGVSCPESEQQKNRRTEFEVLLNGVNIAHLICK
ncbi:MAG: OmpA family protein [Pedobacter sp.]|jgi:outer membrane protein OmpA-like peptidoglycan-associated protein